MRHQIFGRHLGRTSAHRTALRRNLAASLFEHGAISTTRQKAKFVKPFAEKLISLGKDGSLHARRRAIALLQDRNISKVENGVTVKVDTVVHKLFSEIAPQFVDRNGGYTRIINLPLRRVGDNGQLVLLQLVGEQKVARSPKRESRGPVTVAHTDASEKATESVAEGEETGAADSADDAEVGQEDAVAQDEQDEPGAAKKG